MTYPMARKDCEYCKKHRARWLVEVKDNSTNKKYRIKVCGICRWKLWPSPRKFKTLEIIRVITNVRGKRRRLMQPHLRR